MPAELKATFRIVTPMFLGGADQQEPVDAIRPPSVKGMLRFWWRALQWGRVLHETKSETKSETGSEAAALRLLHQREARLFGLAATDGHGGQGSFILRVSRQRLRSTAINSVHPDFARAAAARYLGYGLMEAFASRVKGTQAGQLSRPCIDPNQEFSVHLRSRTHINPDLIEALQAWGLLGGLGSRSRHGMGSVALVKMEDGSGARLWQAPTSPEQYRERLNELLATLVLPNNPPPYTAFSARSRIDILVVGDEGDSAIEVMNQFADAELMYRSWGRGGRVLNRDSEKRFEPDHDWKHGVRPRGFHPRRVIFGLPHNYGQGAKLAVNAARHERRSSPLLFHVHPLGKQFIGVSLLLPAQFLPNGEMINAGGKQVPQKIEWSLLTDFLDGKPKGSTDPRFPNKTTLR